MVTMVMAHLLSCHLYFCSGLPSPRAPNRGTWAKSTPHHGLPRNTPYPSPLLSSPSLSSGTTPTALQLERQ
ncbi:hypothetical protein EJ110_NYTH49291 [Nymphaea thermarum]|nr:hypothetical protein EJ110_NYTH49291 [Nymphaea thermarum]